MRKYRILELVITRDQTRNALHAPNRSLQAMLQESQVRNGWDRAVKLNQLYIFIFISELNDYRSASVLIRTVNHSV